MGQEGEFYCITKASSTWTEADSNLYKEERAVRHLGGSVR